MELELLRTLGTIAGIAGLGLGVLLLVLRQLIAAQYLWPQLRQTHAFSLLRLIIILLFILAVLGIVAWLIVFILERRSPPPIARIDSAATEAGNDVTLRVMDNDEGRGIRVTEIAQPSYGRASVAADGTLRYAPALRFVGTDKFSYRIADTFGRTASATVSIVVSAPNLVSVTIHFDVDAAIFADTSEIPIEITVTGQRSELFARENLRLTAKLSEFGPVIFQNPPAFAADQQLTLTLFWTKSYPSKHLELSVTGQLSDKREVLLLAKTTFALDKERRTESWTIKPPP